MANDTPLLKRKFDLGLKLAANAHVIGDDELRYYEEHLQEIPDALRRGVVIPHKPDPLFTLMGSVPVNGMNWKWTSVAPFEQYADMDKDFIDCFGKKEEEPQEPCALLIYMSRRDFKITEGAFETLRGLHRQCLQNVRCPDVPLLSNMCEFLRAVSVPGRYYASMFDGFHGWCSTVCFELHSPFIRKWKIIGAPFSGNTPPSRIVIPKGTFFVVRAKRFGGEDPCFR